MAIEAMAGMFWIRLSGGSSLSIRERTLQAVADWRDCPIGSRSIGNGFCGDDSGRCSHKPIDRYPRPWLMTLSSARAVGIARRVAKGTKHAAARQERL
jgi:hypothetical protein